MSAVLYGQLTYLMGQRQQAFRPLVWRSMLPINSNIPKWAENVKVIRVQQNAAEPVPHQIGNQKAPSPSLNRDSGTLPLIEFALAYQIWQAELDRKAQTGIDVSALDVLSNQRSAEEFLDKIASLGYSTYGLPGLLSSADVTPNAVGATPPGSSAPIVGDWDNADPNDVLRDISSTIFSVYSQSSNLLRANVCAIPDIKYQTLATRFNTYGVSILELAQKANKDVQFVPWYRLNTAGVASATRMMAFTSAQDVAEMLLPSELTDGKPLEVHGGFEVLQTLKTGGVMIHQPKGIAYTDGI